MYPDTHRSIDVQEQDDDLDDEDEDDDLDEADDEDDEDEEDEEDDGSEKWQLSCPSGLLATGGSLDFSP